MFGNKTFTPEEIQAIQQELDQKLGVKEVCFRPGPDNCALLFSSKQIFFFCIL